MGMRTGSDDTQSVERRYSQGTGKVAVTATTKLTVLKVEAGLGSCAARDLKEL
jgi:hypothetical protein